MKTGVVIETCAIGDELLDGRITDRNASGLARALRDRHAAVSRMSVVSDDLDQIVALFDEVAERAHVLVCSGGLGPTRDDRTRDAAARWLGVDLEYHEESFTRIEMLFAAVGMEATDNNRRQAYFPRGARILPNEVGTAPAFLVECPKRNLKVYFLPGVPREYTWFLNTYVLDEIASRGEGKELVRKTRIYFGIGESKLEHTILDLDVPDGIALGYRAHFPEIHVTVSGWSAPGDGVREGVETLCAQIQERLGKYFVAEGHETLVKRVGRLLKERGATLATVESCTGGMIAAELTSVPGSSAFFDVGYVTYSNEAKRDLVHVALETLDTHGAVSTETVCEMARGGLMRSGADFAVAVSGVAGPGGGSPEKPVGTVDLAVASPRGVWIRPLRMKKYWGRDRIRQSAVHHALALVLKILEERVSDDSSVRFLPASAREDV